MTNQLLQTWLKAGNTTITNVLLKEYRQIGLSNEQLVLVLQLKSFMDAGILFPDTEEIAKRMEISSAEAFRGIHELIQKKFLTIETEKNSDGKTNDQYSLTLLWDKLGILLIQTEKKVASEEQELSEQELFRRFEAEFGRTLSPIEMQTIGMWLDDDKYPIDLIELALREAVLSQVYNLKYVDRILLNWERKNIRSKAQVENETKRHRQNKAASPSGPSTDKEPGAKVPLHNWLNNNN